MTIPLLPERTFHDSRAISESGLRHAAQIGTLQSIRQPNGEYVDTWVFGAPIPCLYLELSARDATIAAAKGIKAQGVLVFKQTAPVYAGNQAMVRGITDGVAWERLVEITDENWMTGRVHRQCLVIDVDLSP